MVQHVADEDGPRVGRDLRIIRLAENDLDAIERSINGAPRVNGLIHMRTMHLGPEQLLVAAKIDYDNGLTIAELAEANDRTEVDLRAAVPIATLVYIEPDIRRELAE